MSEAADQPADAGVEGPGAAQTDDIDTEAFDRVEAPEDEEEPEASADGETEDDPDKPKPEPDDDSVEVEHEGQKLRVPKALKDAFLRHADYTHKTTELAQARRSLDEERTTWESQREQSRAALPEEHAQVAVLSHELSALDKRIEQFKTIDWDAWRIQVQGLDENDANRLKYAQYRDAYMAARDTRIDLVDRLDGAKADLQSKEATRLKEQQAAEEADLAKRREETGKALAAQVPGWNVEKATAVATFMATDLGMDAEEIGQATDPRLWKFIHTHLTEKAELAKLREALKQQQAANKNVKDQGARPAERPKGGGAAPRDP